jgi:sarcosine oxidase
VTERVFDAIVAGLGAHGSAAAYHLAKRGHGVLGFDRFARGHTFASFGGLSRIIRLSYYEHPSYVPLLKRAWDLWREVERDSGETLLTQTGGLYMGPVRGELVSGSLASARMHGLEHELLDNTELQRRYPLFDVDHDWVGLLDVQAGWLAPERCVETHLHLAERHGATLRFAEPIERWERDGDDVRVTSAQGSYRARRLVITAGAWLSRLLPQLTPHLWVERNVLFWFEPRLELEAFAKLPVYIVEDTDRFYYGFPYDPSTASSWRVSTSAIASIRTPSTASRARPTRNACARGCAAACRSRTENAGARRSACTRTVPTGTSSSIAMDRSRTRQPVRATASNSRARSASCSRT